MLFHFEADSFLIRKVHSLMTHKERSLMIKSFISINSILFILILSELFIAALALKMVFDHLFILFMIDLLLDCIS
jgi:hypothetical protein